MVCHRCGLLGVLSRNCPLCDCGYCHKEGHTLEGCPNATNQRTPVSDQRKRLIEFRKATEVRGSGRAWKPKPKYGHVFATDPVEYGSDNQPLQTLPKEKPGITRDYSIEEEENESDARPLSDEDRPLKRPKLNRSMFEEDELEDDSLNEDKAFFIFPDLEKLIEDMIKVICSTENDTLLKKYRVLITQRIGRQKTPRLLLQCIDDAVKGLENRRVTIRAVKDVRYQQVMVDGMFDCAGGYLNMITDNRDTSYHKFYIGQSRNLEQRIRQHSVCLSRGATNSLHYFIYALGKDNRSFCFIRLFDLKSVSEELIPKADRLLFLSLLEHSMCLAFRSLPNNICNRFLEDQMPLNPRNVHLNVLLPLEQAKGSAAQARENARGELLHSSDPEIRSWPPYRLNTKPPQKAQKKFPTFDELRKGISKVVTDEFRDVQPEWIKEFSLLSTKPQLENFDLQEELERSSKEISEKMSMLVTLEPPVGSLNAALAILYSLPLSSSNKTAQSTTAEKIPFDLNRVGLTTNDLLIWDLDFGTSSIDVCQKENFGSAVTVTDQLSETMIKACQAKIVILAGTNPQRFLTEYLSQRTEHISGPLDVNLGGLSMRLYIENCDNRIGRIYINAPELTKTSNEKGWGRFRETSSIFKAVSMLLGNETIKYRFFEGERIKAKIFGLIRQEKEGHSIGDDPLDESIRGWLGDRGFRTQEDLDKLVAIGRRWGRSLHLMLVVLAVMRSGSMGPSKGGREKDRPEIDAKPHERMSKDSLEAMYKLVQQKLETEQASRRFPASGDHHTSTVTDHGTLNERDIIEIELPNTDTVAETDSSERAAVLEADIYEKFDLPEEMKPTEAPDDGESDLESDFEDFRTRSQQQFEDNVSDLIKQGLSYEAIVSRFPKTSHNSIRRIWNSKAANVKPRGDLIRGDDRIRQMFQEGLDMHVETLNILDVILRVNLDRSHAQQGIKFSSPCRIWIEVLESRNREHRPWLESTRHPELQRFVFKIAQQNQGKQDSIPFYPKIQGESRGTKTPEQFLEIKERLARQIMKLFRDWKKNQASRA